MDKAFVILHSITDALLNHTFTLFGRTSQITCAEHLCWKTHSIQQWSKRHCFSSYIISHTVDITSCLMWQIINKSTQSKNQQLANSCRINFLQIHTYMCILSHSTYSPPYQDGLSSYLLRHLELMAWTLTIRESQLSSCELLTRNVMLWQENAPAHKPKKVQAVFRMQVSDEPSTQ